MDHETFDRIVRLLGTPGSRRAALGGLLGAGLLGAGLETAARNRNRNKKRNGRAGERDKGKRGGKDRSKVGAEQVPADCCSSGNCAPGKAKALAKCCYDGDDVSGKTFTSSDLRAANFAGATAVGANFRSANLGNACFVDADLTDAKVNNSTNLAGAIFCRTTMPDGSVNDSGCNKGTACCPTCETDDACPTGRLCCNGRCRDVECCGTGQPSTCPEGETCCRNACVDLDTDPDNCGACGNACDPGTECIRGDCLGPVMEVILSGGPDQTTEIFVDDDLRVELNGQIIFNDNDTFANRHPPIAFQARNGDSLRIVATDAKPFCHELSPLYLHAVAGGAVQTLDADGFPGGCPDVAVGVFYDQTFTISL